MHVGSSPRRPVASAFFFYLAFVPPVTRIRAVIRRFTSAAFAALMILFAVATSARAATCTVTSTADSGAGSLRACITGAASGDMINFGTTGTITLASSLPTINEDLTIQGPASGGVAISGANAYTVFTIYSGTVSISGLTIANGVGLLSGGITYGGGVTIAGGTVVVNDCAFTGNSAPGGYGAAIYTQAPLTVTNSVFTRNSSALGGAIFVLSNIGTLTNNTFVGNSASNGGALYDDGTVTVSNNTFSGNSAPSNSGGAIYNLGTLTAVNNILIADSGGECVGSGCPGNAVSGNVVGGSNLLFPLGNYGGPTQTMLPQPGSAAVCAGSSSLVPSGVTTDQRGFPLDPSCVDAGAVQTNYTTVTTANDSGAGSLRAAITAANSSGYGDIDFDPSLNGATITLASTLPGLTGQENIVGPGANLLTVSGANAYTVFTIYSLGRATLNGLTIANGNGNGSHGGGVLNAGTLAVANTIFSGNTADAGGGIFDEGVGLTVTNSTFENNIAAVYGFGGGINDDGDTVTVMNSTFAGNSAGSGVGGGIYNNAGTVIVTNDTFSGNSAAAGGGIDNNDTLVVSNSVLTGDTGGECVGSGCPTNLTSGNIVDATETVSNLAALGTYGGSTLTMLPLPGSAAICAGVQSAAIDGNGNPLTTDQRGFPVGASSYCSAGTVDSGAVQTNYQSIQFTNAGGGTSCAADFCGVVAETVNNLSPNVSVTENGQNIGGVPVTLIFSGTGTATGLGPLTTATGAGVTFSSLSVNALGSDTLSSTLQITPSASLTIKPAATLDITQTPVTLTPTIIPSSTYIYGATPPSVSVGLSATPTPGGITASEFAASLLNLTTSATTPLTVTLSAANTVTISGISTTLAAGSYSLVIDFAGAPGYEGGSLSIPITVEQAGTTVSGTTPTLAYGQAGSSTVTVTGVAGAATPSGTVSYSIDGGTAQSVTLTAGSASVPVPNTLSGGAHSIRLTYNGDTNYLSSSGTVNFTIGIAANTITFTQPAAVTYGTAPVTLTASATSGAAVTFTLASGPATLSGNVLTITGTGSVVITASQAAGVDYAAPTPVTRTLTVNKATATVSGTAPSIAFGQSGSANVAVAGVAGGTVPGGTVGYSIDGATSQNVALASGSATVPIPNTLSAGSHSIALSYSGDANYLPGTATLSLSITEGTLSITANNATRVYGTANPAFTGTMTGEVNGDSFTETFTTSATVSSNVGTYAIVPSVTGANLGDYTMQVTDGTLTVTQASTTTTLSASANSINPGQSITLTAQVQSTSAGSITGSVNFYDGTTLLGTATLSAGAATYTTSTLSAGATHSLTATFVGDANFAGSTSSTAVSVPVGSLDFSLSAQGSSTQTISSGAIATFNFGLTPSYGTYPSDVTFSTSGLPAGATATFSPATILANAGAQTVGLQIKTASTTASSRESNPFGRGGVPLVFGFLLLPLLSSRRIRESRLGRGMLLLALIAAGLGCVTGCGSTPGPGSEPPQSYSITVTATSGSVQHSVNVTLDVTE